MSHQPSVVLDHLTFARLGASVFIHHYGPHDEGQPWGADDLSDVVAGQVHARSFVKSFADKSVGQCVDCVGRRTIRRFVR